MVVVNVDIVLVVVDFVVVVVASIMVIVFNGFSRWRRFFLFALIEDCSDR